MPSREKLAEFTAWCGKHLTGDEKGEAQIFLDHLFQAFGFPGGLKEAGATLDARVSGADATGTAGIASPAPGAAHPPMTRKPRK